MKADWQMNGIIYIPGSLPDNAYHEMKSAMENLALEASGVGYDIVILNPTWSWGQEMSISAQGRSC